jgi:hypothetical protein
LPPEKVKGFRAPVKIYEVPWREKSAGAPPEMPNPAVTGERDTERFV